MSKEMKLRHRAYNKYRYRRFQALDDALNLYFFLYDSQKWVTVRDICDEFEFDPESNTDTRRVRRICEALERVKKVEIKRTKTRSHPMFIRSLI